MSSSSKQATAMSTSSSTINGQINRTPDDSIDVSTMLKSKTSLSQLARPPTVGNIIIVCLDSNINDSNEDTGNLIAQLYKIVNPIKTFTNNDECFDFLNEIKDDKVFMIVSGSINQQIALLIENMTQVDSIYEFCNQQVTHEQWANECKKVKGIFTEIQSICDAVKRDIRQSETVLTPISIVATTFTHKLDELDQSFMYSRLLKEIIFEIGDDKKDKGEFIAFCHQQYADDDVQLNIIRKFERDYELYSPIWWYTKEPFVYTMLNQALRTQDTEIIIKMGFFLRDLHRQIEQLYLETHQSVNMIIYRGQGMTNVDFEKMKQNKGGLLSFNNFLSASNDRQVSFAYAESAGDNSDLTGILFEVNIDSTISSIPFALLENVSYYSDKEKEILFSMHTVFRIGEMEEIHDQLWKVDLILASDNDEELKHLTDHIRNEMREETGWHRLGILMFKMGKFEKAIEIYKSLIERKMDTDEEEFMASLPIYYNNIGEVYRSMGNYLAALSSFEKTLEIRQKSLPSDDPKIAAIYNNIGTVHQSMTDYSTALSFYEKTLDIQQKSLSPNHPSLAVTYNNLGMTHQSMGHYSTALPYLKKSLEIYQKSFPSKHPELAVIHSNIGMVHRLMGDHSIALSSFEKTLEIHQKSLPPDHPWLAVTYNNLAMTHQLMGHYSTALAYLEKTLEIDEKSLPANHSEMDITYNNIGMVHQLMGDYSTAISYFEKALEMQQESLPPNHPGLAITYDHFGAVHRTMHDYSSALSYYEISLEIRQKSLPPNHPNLAITYSNIGEVYGSMGDYSSSLSYFEKALEIQQKSLPSNHPELATVHNNIGVVHRSMRDYSTALSHFEKALEMQQESLPPNHPELATTYMNLGAVHQSLGDSSTALSYYEITLEIQQKTVPSYHPSLANTYNIIGMVHSSMDDKSAALSSFGKAFEIIQKSSPSNHSSPTPK